MYGSLMKDLARGVGWRRKQVIKVRIKDSGVNEMEGFGALDFVKCLGGGERNGLGGRELLAHKTLSHFGPQTRRMLSSARATHDSWSATRRKRARRMPVRTIAHRIRPCVAKGRNDPRRVSNCCKYQLYDSC